MKYCSRCKQWKSLIDFNKNKSLYDGFECRCRACKNELQAIYRNNNREKVRQISKDFLKEYKKTEKYKTRITKYAKEYYQKNKEVITQRVTKWVKDNPKKHNAHVAKWREENPSKVRAKAARRRAAQLQRTPKWLTKDDWILIEMKYQLADYMNEVTGLTWHVDHIIPLQGENISGLHVPSNLRVITDHENYVKHNKNLLDKKEKE